MWPIELAPSPVTFSDREGHFCCLKTFDLHTLGNAACIVMFTHVACNFNYLFENEGLL